MMHKSLNILQKSIPNQPKWCPGALPKATSQASRRNVGHIFEKNTTIFEKWQMLAAILGFSWAPGVSPNPFVGTKSFQNLKKWHLEWGIRKILIVDWILVWKSEILNVMNPTECCIWRHFGGWRWLWQNQEIHKNSMPKWTPKVIPKSTLERSAVRLFRF